MKREYQVWYQRQSDMIITWIFVDALVTSDAINIAKELLKGENILYAREV